MDRSVAIALYFLVGQILGEDIQPRIAGGTQATIAEFPYLVSVRIGGIHVCGGCIIDPDTIITAAHCINSAATSSLSIQAGTVLRAGPGTVSTARLYQIHPQFNRATMNYDMALIHLTTPLTFGPTIQSIPVYTQQIYGGWIVKTAGWGALREGGALTNSLQKVSLKIQDRATCRSIFGPVLGSGMFCAGWLSGGIGTCDGDPGGPLVSNGWLIGIVSLGNGCARRDFTGLNTKVPLSSAWILNNMNE